MTTGGEGIMVTTNDKALREAMWSFKDHGKSYETVYERQHPPGFRWLHESFGTNWRMLEMQAMIGRIQLQRMHDWTAKRHAHANALAAALRPFAGEGGVVRLPQLSCASCLGSPRCARDDYSVSAGADENSIPVMANDAKPSNCVHAQYKFYAYVRPENLASGWSRDRIIETINAGGVPCYQGSCSEVYLEKAFDGTGWRPAKRLSVAQLLGETSLMWLVHPTLTSENLQKMLGIVNHVMKEASL
jgi:dTDP-4-amino-4,6-dideoxygalactose transaminase